MTSGARRGVTRGYVAALTFAAVVVATSLTVAAWGICAALLKRDPVVSDVPTWAAPLIVALLLAVLAACLWQQAVVLLKGRKTPSWGIIFSLGGGAYLIWSALGNLFGMSISDTWISPFAVILAVIWAVVSVLFWAVLARRVYTDRPTPRWPWETDAENDSQ